MKKLLREVLKDKKQFNANLLLLETVANKDLLEIRKAEILEWLKATCWISINEISSDDLTTLFPDQKVYLVESIQETIGIWEYVFQNMSNRN